MNQNKKSWMFDFSKFSSWNCLFWSHFYEASRICYFFKFFMFCCKAVRFWANFNSEWTRFLTNWYVFQAKPYSCRIAFIVNFGWLLIFFYCCFLNMVFVSICIAFVFNFSFVPVCIVSASTIIWFRHIMFLHQSFLIL